MRRRTPLLRRRAFSAGVFDVIELPARAHELQARFRAALGESAPSAQATADGTTLRAGGLILFVSARMVTDEEGRQVRLTRHDCALLALLMSRPGQVVPSTELIRRISAGRGETDERNLLAVHMRRLRAKLAHPRCPHGYIRTVHGHGYLFDARLAPRAAGPVPQSTAEKQILVIDDDRATVALVTEVLERAGYGVTAGMGTEALAMARQRRPELILLDINMPEMDGIEVRQRLRGNPLTAAIPVIAISSGGNLRTSAGDMVADDYLSKPFGADELLLRVEKWLGPAATIGKGGSAGTER